jgi:Tol biopolymer transport system component
MFLKLKTLIAATLAATLLACGGGGGGGAPATANNGSSNLSLGGTAIYSYISTLYAVNMQTGATRTLLKLDLNFSYVGAGVGPAGEFVVAYNNGTTGPTSTILILKPDGSEERRFRLNYTIQGAPQFSPDGTQIAFLAGVYQGSSGLDYFAQVVSRTGESLFFYGDYEVPRWLPGGRLVLSDRNGLYVDAAPSDLNSVPSAIPNSQNISRFALSPDGNSIAFVRSAATGAPRHIYMMNIDGSGTRQVTTSANSEETNMVFSPDGKYLLIRSSGCITVGSSTGVGSVDDDLMHVIPADSTMLNIESIRNQAPTALRDEQGQGRCTSGTISWG